MLNNPSTEKVIMLSSSRALHSKTSDLHYKAKHGDAEAAEELVSKVVKPESYEKLRGIEPGVIVVPVRGVEMAGHNYIPSILAKHIAFHVDGTIDRHIIQSHRANHTGATKKDRFFCKAQFSGLVEYGRKYLLVDDHVTSGATLNSLKRMIESKGGIVVGLVAQSASAGGSNFNIKPETLNRVKELDPDGKIEEILINELGYEHGIQSLTNSEARWLIPAANRTELLSFIQRKNGSPRSLPQGRRTDLSIKFSGQTVRELKEQYLKLSEGETDLIHICLTSSCAFIIGNDTSIVRDNTQEFYLDYSDTNTIVFDPNSAITVASELTKKGYRVGISEAGPEFNNYDMSRHLYIVNDFNKQWHSYASDAVFEYADGTFNNVNYDAERDMLITGTITDSGFILTEDSVEIEIDYTLNLDQNLHRLYEKAITDYPEKAIIPGLSV